MYTHVVLFTLKDPADVPSTVRVLEQMAPHLPMLRGIEIGVDDRPSERSAHICLITRFQEPADLDAYQVHSAHQEALSHVRRVVASTIKVDFES